MAQEKKYDTGIAYVLHVLRDGEKIRVGGETSSTLETSVEMASTNSKDDYGWASNIPTIKSWSVSTENLLTDSEEGQTLIETAYMNGEALEIAIRKPSGTRFQGKVLIETLSYEFAQDGVVSFSASLLGQGALDPVFKADAPTP